MDLYLPRPCVRSSTHPTSPAAGDRDHATRRQVVLYKQAEAESRTHRGRLRETRCFRPRGRAAGLGNGEQGRRGREEEWLRPWAQEQQELFAEGRQKGRCRLGRAVQVRSIGCCPQGRRNATPQSRWEHQGKVDPEAHRLGSQQFQLAPEEHGRTPAEEHEAVKKGRTCPGTSAGGTPSSTQAGCCLVVRSPAEGNGHTQ